MDYFTLDPLLKEAATIVVQHQSGSASLIQRQLKLGYNRAGRIIDQLEDLGIVGPFFGSQSRKVLCTDVSILNKYMEELVNCEYLNEQSVQQIQEKVNWNNSRNSKSNIEDNGTADALNANEQVDNVLMDLESELEKIFNETKAKTGNGYKFRREGLIWLLVSIAVMSIGFTVDHTFWPSLVLITIILFGELSRDSDFVKDSKIDDPIDLIFFLLLFPYISSSVCANKWLARLSFLFAIVIFEILLLEGILNNKFVLYFALYCTSIMHYLPWAIGRLILKSK